MEAPLIVKLFNINTPLFENKLAFLLNDIIVFSMLCPMKALYEEIDFDESNS